MRARVQTFIIASWLGACVENAPRPAHHSEAPRAHPDTIWWSPDLELSSLDAIPGRLSQPFDEPFDVVALVDGKVQSASAGTCSTALSLWASGYEPMAAANAAPFKLITAQCHVIRDLSRARPAKERSLVPFALDSHSLDRLPPTLGPEPSPLQIERREAARKSGQSWRALDPGAQIQVADSGHAKVLGDGWTTELVLMARGDLDADGQGDIVVRTLSYGSEGSWSEVGLHQLAVADPGAVLRVVNELRL